jgi:hypothetical protein
MSCSSILSRTLPKRNKKVHILTHKIRSDFALI